MAKTSLSKQHYLGKHPKLSLVMMDMCKKYGTAKVCVTNMVLPCYVQFISHRKCISMIHIEKKSGISMVHIQKACKESESDT